MGCTVWSGHLAADPPLFLRTLLAEGWHRAICAFCSGGLWVGVQVGSALTQMRPRAHSCIFFI